MPNEVAPQASGSSTQEKPQIRASANGLDVPVSPWQLLILLTASVFFAELTIMGFIYELSPFSALENALFDSFTLTLFLFVMIHYFMYRPLVREIHRRRQAEEALEEANKTLESKIQQRTKELQEANQRLVQEIETRKWTESELRKSEERYRLLIDTMSEGLEVVDSQGLITYVNQRLCEMLGYSADEMIGRSMNDFFVPKHADFFETSLKDLRQCALGHHEVSWVTKEGKEIYTIFSPRLFFDQESRLMGCFAVVTDITDRKLMEEALRESENKLRVLSSKMLSAQEQERKRLARELHDQLGQDLATLKLQVRSLQNAVTGKDPKAISQCKELSDYIDEVIENVRRLYQDLGPTPLEDLGLTLALRWLVDDFAKHHSIEACLETEEVDQLLSQDAQLMVYRVVQEALNNTGKHAQASRVLVSLSKARDEILVTIADNGRGFKADGSSRKTHRGEGMGLIFMDERAWMLGGSLSVKSEPGKGTQVILAVPVLRGAGL